MKGNIEIEKNKNNRKEEALCPKTSSGFTTPWQPRSTLDTLPSPIRVKDLLTNLVQVHLTADWAISHMHGTLFTILLGVIGD